MLTVTSDRDAALPLLKSVSDLIPADSVLGPPVRSSWLAARRSACSVCVADVQYGGDVGVVEA